MTRKRLTQICPWLLPIRTRQRLVFFYLGMKMDGHQYASSKREELMPHVLFQTNSLLYNKSTGFDMFYQENKVYNLKLAAAPLNKLVIGPKETFSFWKVVKEVDKEVPYKEGLAVIDGELTTAVGGGLCQISNLLFWMFLHSPLTIVERHGHGMKDFPDPDPNGLAGIDATIAEGWLDLKVRNDTEDTFQISITFDEAHIYGALHTERDRGVFYQVVNGQPKYYRENGRTVEIVDVFQNEISNQTGGWSSSKHLYQNQCQIGYPLPPGTIIKEKG